MNIRKYVASALVTAVVVSGVNAADVQNRSVVQRSRSEVEKIVKEYKRELVGGTIGLAAGLTAGIVGTWFLKGYCSKKQATGILRELDVLEKREILLRDVYSAVRDGKMKKDDLENKVKEIDAAEKKLVDEKKTLNDSKDENKAAKIKKIDGKLFCLSVKKAIYNDADGTTTDNYDKKIAGKIKDFEGHFKAELQKQIVEGPKSVKEKVFAEKKDDKKDDKKDEKKDDKKDEDKDEKKDEDKDEKKDEDKE